MPSPAAAAAAVLPLLLAVSLALAPGPALAGVGSIEAPCSACKAVARELQLRLDKEPVRNHLDFRHRLDSEGKRYGKMVQYKISELRAIELLEGLCNGMRSYTLITANTTTADGRASRTKHWESVYNITSGARRSLKSVETNKQKQLEVFCGRILEEHEEDLTAAIQAGHFEEGGTAGYVCNTMLHACPPGNKRGPRSRSAAAPAAEDPADNTDDLLETELGATVDPPPPPPPADEGGGDGDAPGGAGAEASSDGGAAGVAGEAGAGEPGPADDEL